jgi:hypothetical protein
MNLKSHVINTYITSYNEELEIFLSQHPNIRIKVFETKPYTVAFYTGYDDHYRYDNMILVTILYYEG